MKTTNITLHELATVQTAVQELFKKHTGICGLNSDGIHLSESFFHSLFQDKREVVGRKDFSKENPFMYYTHFSGTKFICLSKNPDLFPTYPVEKLAQDLAMQWTNQEHPITSAVFYIDGSYKIQAFKEVETDDLPVYTYPQLISDESVTLEQAILDHMEVKHNENI